MKPKYKKKTPPAERYSPKEDRGLSASEVETRKKEGQVNFLPKSETKSYGKIFFDNICTFFNLIWAVIFAVNLVIFCQGQTDIGHLFFISVIVANTGIAIIEEIRAKRQVEKLSLSVAPTTEVIRDGAKQRIPSEELVLDDVVFYEAGCQIPADSILLSGKTEMNESVLTGESDAVKKKPGDTLLSGSFVVAGGCSARVDKVGTDSYIQTVARSAKAFKSPKSDLFRDITRLIRVIGIGIIPFSVLMFFHNYRLTGGEIYETLLKTSGSIQGMIPAGMFLLITVALSAGVFKLGRKNTLVRDIYSVEMLSRTNMLCLDKTGTLTDGTMTVTGDRVLLAGTDIAKAVAGIFASERSENFTAAALKAAYKAEGVPASLYHIPFSSARKFTASSFKDLGTYALGAPEFLSVGKLDPALASEIEKEAAKGKRVLMLAYSKKPLSTDELPPMTPAALIFLEDHIRPEAPDTIRWFRENRVAVRIISGDNPATVAAIAARVGVENAESCVSLEGMTKEEVEKAAENYTVFGRVTPEQKHILVKKLRSLGNVVAMTGDGVNDTLALKEADCSVAMADGSDVARGISNIVLRDNSFAGLPAVVREGRQVINNVQRSSSLFLMKTFAVIFLSLGCILFGQKYPFETNMLTLLEVFVTGIPSVLLALEPNDNLLEGRFLREVLKKCIPAGLLMLLSVTSVMLVQGIFGLYNEIEYTSLLTLSFLVAGEVNLLFICLPLTRIRVGTLFFSVFGASLAIYIGGATFGIGARFTLPVLLSLLILGACCVPLHYGLTKLWERIGHAWQNRKSRANS